MNESTKDEGRSTKDGVSASDGAIGTAKGPGELPHEFTFITADTGNVLRHGEFVYYRLEVDGAARRVLGRVTARALVRQYPDGFLADSTLPPDEVADMVGCRLTQSELFEVTVAILGYFDETLGSFENPRIAPRLGEPIHLADDALLRQVLGVHQPGERGAATVGWLLSRPAEAVPIVLAAEEFAATHLAIIAGTGAGKSYLAGVVVEELMKANNRASVLIVDPHGEYGTLEELASRPVFREGAYEARAHVVRPERVKVRINGLSLADLRHLMANMTEKQDYYLTKAYDEVTKNDKHASTWTMEHLLEAVRQVGKQAKDDGELSANTVGALEWRLMDLKRKSRIFDEQRDIELQDYFKPGQCTVLPLNDIDEKEQQVIVTVLLRKLFKARQATVRGEATDQADINYLPFPVFVLLEEAHTYAPAGADVVSTRELKRILAEGRKFGVGVGLITQRPGKVHADVLSQCMTQCIMRIVNPIDQAAVAEAVESVGRDLLDELPALTKGQVIIAGSAVRTPVLCQVRRRHTTHGGISPNAPSEWHEAWTRQKMGGGAIPMPVTPLRRGDWDNED